MVQLLLSVCVLLLPGMGPPYTTTYEEAFFDALKRGEIPSPPRLPVFVDGDLTYDAEGNPVYDDGDDLWSGQSDRLFSGRYAAEVAEFIMAQEGVRIAVAGADSQWSGGSNRIASGIARTWPVTWSRWWAPPVSNDPWFWTRGGVDDFILTSSWAYPFERSQITGVSLQDVLRAEGINDPKMITMPIGWVRGGTGSSFGSIGSRGLNAPELVWHDPNNWGNGHFPVKLRFRQWFLSGGESEIPTQARLKVEHYIHGNPTHDVTISSISDTTALPNTHSLGADNGEILMSYTDSIVVDHTISSVSYRPRCVLFEHSEDFNGKSFFMLGGSVSRYIDDRTPEDNISLVFNRYCAGMNPSVFIHDAELSGTSSISRGADDATRAFVYEGAFTPNVLLFSFGHNFPVREGSGFKARSTFQADLFDLIVQEVQTVERLSGETPMVVVVMPWYAARMDQTRHNQMVGVVQALSVHGIKTLGVDLFNLFGGTGFEGRNPENVTDWVNSDTFRLDGDGDPTGTGVHPLNRDSARIAAYGIWRCIEAAAASNDGEPRRPEGALKAVPSVRGSITPIRGGARGG